MSSSERRTASSQSAERRLAGWPLLQSSLMYAGPVLRQMKSIEPEHDRKVPVADELHPIAFEDRDGFIALHPSQMAKLHLVGPDRPAVGGRDDAALPPANDLLLERARIATGKDHARRSAAREQPHDVANRRFDVQHVLEHVIRIDEIERFVGERRAITVERGERALWIPLARFCDRVLGHVDAGQLRIGKVSASRPIQPPVPQP